MLTYERRKLRLVGVVRVAQIVDASECRLDAKSRRKTYKRIIVRVNEVNKDMIIKRVECNTLLEGQIIEVIDSAGFDFVLRDETKEPSVDWGSYTMFSLWSLLLVYIIQTFIRRGMYWLITGFMFLCTFDQKASAQDIGIQFDWILPETVKLIDKNESGDVYKFSDSKGLSAVIAKVKHEVSSVAAMEAISARSLSHIAGNMPQFTLRYQDRNLVINHQKYVLFIYSYSDGKNNGLTYVYSYHTLIDKRMINLIFYCSEETVAVNRYIIGDILDSIRFNTAPGDY